MRNYTAVLFFFLLTNSSQLFASSLVINDSKWPPFFYGDGKTNGFGREVLSKCLDDLKINHTFKFHPIKRMRKGMEKGLLDINIYSYKKSREDFLFFGKEPIFKSSYNPIVLKDSTVKISKLEDFDNYKLGHQIGLRYSDEYHAYIKKRKSAGNLDEANSNDSNLKKLLSGRIDVFVGTKSSILLLAKKMKITDKIKVLDFNIRISDYFVALSKKTRRVEDPQKFLSDVDQCISKLKSTDAYCNIAKIHDVSCKI